MTFATTTDHVAVTVSDLDRSIAFYCGLLGLREVAEENPALGHGDLNESL